MVKLISIGRNFTQCNEDADKTCFPGKLDQTLDLSYYPMLPQHNPSFLPSYLLPPSALCHRPCPWEAARSKGFNLFPQRKKKKSQTKEVDGEKFPIYHSDRLTRSQALAQAMFPCGGLQFWLEHSCCDKGAHKISPCVSSLASYTETVRSPQLDIQILLKRIPMGIEYLLS